MSHIFYSAPDSTDGLADLLVTLIKKYGKERLAFCWELIPLKCFFRNIKGGKI